MSRIQQPLPDRLICRSSAVRNVKLLVASGCRMRPRTILYSEKLQNQNTSTEPDRVLSDLIVRLGVNPAPCPPLNKNPQMPLTRLRLICACQPVLAGVDLFCDRTVLAPADTLCGSGPVNIAQTYASNGSVSARALDTAVQLLQNFPARLP